MAQRGLRNMVQRAAIEVVKASTHNLKAIDCRVPHGKVTVVTGPSGSGKSSLAFDTIYAEGQRRFIESMSTYARQFLQQMERPPVEEVRNILPPVAIEANRTVRNARSTVGTITEVHDTLRLLFTHVGELICPRDGEPARRFTAAEAAAQLAAGAAGGSFVLLVRLPRPALRANERLAELIRQGYGRRWEDKRVVRMSGAAKWLVKLDPLVLVLGRYRSGTASRSRIAAAIEEGFALSGGRVEARGVEPQSTAQETVTIHFTRQLGCSACGDLFPQPVPALFSFNSPLGACTGCQGFGRIIGVDRDRVVPDPSRSLRQRPFAPWNTPAYEGRYERLEAACRERGVPLDVAWCDLTAEDREWIWSGKGNRVNMKKFFKWLEKRSYKVHVRVLLARYRAYDPCPQCAGTRLRDEARRVRIDGHDLPSLTAMTIEELRRWMGRRWSRRERDRAGHLLSEIGERLDVLHRVGLDYLSLDRQARSLSGGETQRIHLAAALGSGLTDTLYVLDEPTIGLHPQDSGKLLGLLRSLARRGNTVLVVEHDESLIRGADHIIDLGPAAGEHGGEVMVEGTLRQVLAGDSLTATYLRRRPATAARTLLARFRRERGRESVADEIKARPRIRILGAQSHNLRNLDVEFALGVLVAVTGVSGSGKSTLVENVLYGNYQRSRGVGDIDAGLCREIEGLEHIGEMVLVSQRPLGRSSRSNPITYIKAYDDIRKLFAAEPLARDQGIKAGHFSFNLDLGRCPECRGTGVNEVDMQFMAPVTVVCDSCQGRRFRPEVLAIRCRGLTIAETLELTVDTALEVFSDRRRLCRRLQTLLDVGLGYLRLGQSTSTLSGGEAQRLKLASFLDTGERRGHLFLFDEPTTGLHLADIDLLYRTLRRLVQGGNSVVVVEHNPALIQRADWIVDLGPGGGVHGGELLFSGPLIDFLEEAAGPTADELRRQLRWPLGIAPDRADG